MKLDTIDTRVYSRKVCGAPISSRGLPSAFGLLTALIPVTASAAYPTRVLTAVEPKHPLPELHLGVTFDRDMRHARIVREWVQQERAVDVRELKLTETIQRLLLDLKVGVFRDLEFHSTLPLVLSANSEIVFDDGVSASSTIWGSDNAQMPFPITEVPAARERGGFGDMTFGLAWSPFVDRKDEAYPTLTLRADIVAPTGKARDPADQDALPDGPRGSIGRGRTVFDLSIGLSRRTREEAPAFDPYMLFGAEIPVATSGQKKRGLDPAPAGRFLVGTEVIVYESSETSEYYSVDLSFGARYVGIGRDYSPLSDYLPNLDQTKLPEVLPDDPDPIYADPNRYAVNIDGARCGLVEGVPCGELNRIDEHLDLAGALSLHIRPVQYFLFRTGLVLGFTTNHVITSEKVGEDRDPPGAGPEKEGRVNAENSLGQDERSPYYDPRYDQPGRRLRAEEMTSLMLFVTAALLF